MAIHYCLYENKLVTGETAFAARFNPVDSVELEEIATAIAERGTTVTKEDILAVLEGMCTVCENFLVLGFRVNMGGLFELYPSIKGNFTDPTDVFDSTRHKLDVTGNAGTRVKKVVKENAYVEKDPTTLPAPAVQKYFDSGSTETNATVTPGNIGTITGRMLKYDSTNPDEGIFFVNAVGNGFKVNTVENNKPTKLTYLVPSLADGDYTLEVRSKFSKDGEVRTGVLPHTLTVGIAP